MNIFKCDKCGKMLHETDRCFFCGNRNGFTKVDIEEKLHDNVKSEYERLEFLVKHGRFSDALTVSDSVLEWMPLNSSVFWLRLLAQKRCTNDKELLQTGFSCDDSADFYNAVLYANEFEKQLYSDMKRKVLEVRDVLLNHVTNHEYVQKEATTILAVRESYADQLKKCKEKLFKLCEELNQQESKIMALENDCLLFGNEYKDTLNNARNQAVQFRNETMNIYECSMKTLHRDLTFLGKILHLSEEAKLTMENARVNHPWVKTYNSLVKKRDDIVSQINNELKSLKKLETEVESVVKKFEEIEETYANAKYLINHGDFSKAKGVLDDAHLNAAFSEVDIL